MSEIHLSKPGCTYSACGSFAKKEYKNLNRRFTIYLSKQTR